MLLTTGAIALARKVADEKKKRKEAKQGLLKVGDTDVAKRAFDSQTSKMLEGGNPSVKRAGTEIQYEDPNDVLAKSADTASPTIYSPRPEIHDARQSSQYNVASPVQSEKAAPGSPYAETPATTTDFGDSSSLDNESQRPPPYSPNTDSEVRTLSSSMYSRDPSGSKASMSDTKSISSRSTNSRGTHALRVKTKGPELNSGFPYHPALFDLRIHPEQWESFTSQVIETTKLSAVDNAKVWGAATATALTGAIATSIFVGNSMKRSVHEKKVKAGLDDMSSGGLGDKLRLWNEEYFSKRGLFVHLELSESTMKKDGKTSTFRKPASFYSNAEDRERKREERKFVIVVTKLDEEGQPMEALNEFAGTDRVPVEIGSSGVPEAAELPAEMSRPVELAAETIVELPAEESFAKEKVGGAPAGYVEMDSDNTHLLEKMNLGDGGPPVH